MSTVQIGLNFVPILVLLGLFFFLSREAVQDGQTDTQMGTNSYSHHCEKNGKFCVTVRSVTKTAGSQSVKGADC